MRTWRHVSHSDPCPICGKSNWCAVSADGAVAICRRVDTGAGVHRMDKAGGYYWLYRLDGHSTCRQPSIALPSLPHVKRADPATLDHVYREMLAALPLLPHHRQALRQRGLVDVEILRRRYRTFPLNGRAALAKRLIEHLGADVCAQVPGFYTAERDNRRWRSLAGAAGLLVPIRNVDGHIVALKVRADEPGDGPKYTTISSAKHAGPSPGAQVHVPMYDGPHRDTIRLTEGELKADVSTVLSSALTIAIPGVAMWRKALPVMQALQPTRVLLAFDADWRQNPHVARALAQATQALVEAGFTAAVETWDTSYGKGIEDVLVRGHLPTVQSVVPWLYKARTLPETSGGRPAHMRVEVQ